MEIIEESINFNDGVCKDFRQYKVDGISDLEEGTIFGIIASKFDMAAIYPGFSFADDGNVTYHLNKDYDIIQDYFYEKDEQSEKADVIEGGEDRPFIFKKLKGNLAQELLSGEVFILAKNPSKDDYDFDNFELGIENFQQAVEQYKNNNILICSNVERWGGKGSSDGIFVVDDEFKDFYGKMTLQYRDEIAKVLVSLKQYGGKIFTEKYTECVGKAQEVAVVDNFLYDAEHTEEKPRTM